MFGRDDLQRVCKEELCERVGYEEAMEAAQRVRMGSSAFTVWQGECLDKRGRFVINFKTPAKALTEEFNQDGYTEVIRDGTAGCEYTHVVEN